MLLEISGLDIAKYIVIVFQVLVCLLLILVVMMQRPKQAGLGAAFGGDTMGELAGAHATDFLQKGTAFLGTLLFVLTFILSILVIKGAEDGDKSLANDSEIASKVEDDAQTPEQKEELGELPANPDAGDGEEPNPLDVEGETGDSETPEKSGETGESNESTGSDEEVNPLDAAAGEDKPAEDKPAEDKPAEDKPADK